MCDFAYDLQRLAHLRAVNSTRVVLLLCASSSHPHFWTSSAAPFALVVRKDMVTRKFLVPGIVSDKFALLTGVSSRGVLAWRSVGRPTPGELVASAMSTNQREKQMKRRCGGFPLRGGGVDVQVTGDALSATRL